MWQSGAVQLSSIATALAKVGDNVRSLARLKQALEAAQKLEVASEKEIAVSNIAMTLAMGSTIDIPDRPVIAPMKTTFTADEKQLAKQLVEAMQGN